MNMRKKSTILLVIALLFMPSIAMVPVATCDNEDVGDVYFNQTAPDNALKSSASGTVNDYFYYHVLVYEPRPNHGSYYVRTLIDRCLIREIGKAWSNDKVEANEKIVPHENIVDVMWKYNTPSGFTDYKAQVQSWFSQSSQGDPENPDVSIIWIDVTTGTGTTWDYAFAVDFSEYPDSTVEFKFTDGDYELVDVPDAGDTTEIETENGYEIKLTTTLANDKVSIAITNDATISHDVILYMA